ncbi:GNAT family N-acetyltransferase [Streptomyces polyrhachis]|uniref:GNAT family N-acetyltransferase n=1 Tax=Streptomyces polyrhachis TaxID=1282885 RepID=A0ABW2GC50_9ACTN
MTSTDSLRAIEAYYDAVPRAAARVEEFGPLRLFVREGAGFPYYARPAGGEPTAEAVLAVRERQRELGIPEAFEWVAEVTPGLREAVEATGLKAGAHPLLVLEGALGPAVETPGVVVRLLGADDPELAPALAAVHLAFGRAGSQEEVAAELTADGTVAATAASIRSGHRLLVAAVDAEGRVLCSGSSLPVGGVAEIGGVGTLPQARRRGLAYAVTRALALAAGGGGVHTLFLSAADESVARIYRRLGFVPRATAMIAEG